MKGVILAGGSGTRLYPLTKTTNKHLLPVYNRPMLHYPITSLIQAGIKEILIISSRDHVGHILNYFGGGRDYGGRFLYDIQDEKSGYGIAAALAIAKDFVGKEKMAVCLGDNLFQDNFVVDVNEYERGDGREAKIFLTKVEDPKPYGVAYVEGRNILRIEEKPVNPTSNLIVTGMYFYPSNVFNFIKKLKVSERGELEITDVNNHYVKKETMGYRILNGFWGDAGESFESYLKACNLAALGDINHSKKRGRPRKHFL